MSTTEELGLVRSYDVPPDGGEPKARTINRPSGLVITVEALANGLERWTYDYTNDRYRI